jgi:hypothetical protein
VRDRNWPVGGDHGPEMRDGLRQQPSSSAIAEVEQRDRRDPITVVIAGPPVVPVDVIRHALLRDPRGNASSPLGCALDAIAEAKS